MKWISFLAFLLICCTPAQARDDSLSSASEPHASFPGNRADSRGSEVQPGVVILNKREIDALIASKSGARLKFPSFERITGNEGKALDFREFDLYAPGARHRLLEDGAELTLDRDPRRFYLATNESTGIGLAVDPVSGETRGFVSKGGSRLEIRGNFVAGLVLSRVVEAQDGASSCETRLGGQPLGLQQELAAASPMSASAAQSGMLISYEAVVAVDTDTEWLGGFSDDANAAMTWISEAFLAMNVFFERDVETRLLIGDVTLRTGSDPYTVENDRFGQLDEFGKWWKDNMGQVDRQFAAMLSGRNISNYGFSGIAWIDQFCEYGRNWGSSTVGSYSYNAIGPMRTPGNTALYLGHEIGHNMGSPHTHCYNPPVDHCYNAAGNGCYSGVPECPAGGRGTIMSYCHVGGSNGAGCGTSKSEFHPAVQSLLEGNLADELVAGCIMEHVSENPELALTPAAGTELDFGGQMIGQQSDSISIRADNSGQADLTLACSLAGVDPGEFVIEACPTVVAPGGSADVMLRCLPATGGNLVASLELASNDPDEPQAVFALACSGLEPPVEEQIFSSDFEN